MNTVTTLSSLQPFFSKWWWRGGHKEDPLAVGGFKICHLDDVGKGLGNVDDPHEDEDQGHIVGEGQATHRAAQKKRTGVPRINTLAGWWL